MKKTLRVLFITLLALSVFMQAQAQTLSSSPTLTFTNTTGFDDHIAQDGDGGSGAVSDINIQVLPINSSGALLTADLLEYHAAEWGTPPIITYGDTFSFFGWSIKSDNGADFSLVSLDFLDWGEATGLPFVVEAFRNGSSLGTIGFTGNTDYTMVHLTNTGVLTSIFQTVDEVRVYRQGGADSWTGLNNIKVSSAASTLPVTWLDFTASQRGMGIVLNWSTALEQNTKNYVVQHSSNGRNWNSVATIAAAGKSSTVQQYSYLHNNIVTGIHYYRLLQRDIDGRESYSKVLAVNLSGTQKSLCVYPNPVVNGRLTVNLEKEAKISLFNPAGVLVWQKQLQAGVHQLQLPRLAKGVYRIKTEEETETFVMQ